MNIGLVLLVCFAFFCARDSLAVESRDDVVTETEFLLSEPNSTPKPERVNTGSGFFVGAQGFLVTALHVVKDRKIVMLRLAQETRWRRAKVVKEDQIRDLALIQISTSGISLMPLTLANSTVLPPGLEAYVIGFPLPKVQGSSMKITAGIVNGESGKQRGLQSFQLSAEVHKGSSGAPVLSPDGRVIGIVQKKLDAIVVTKKTGDFPQNVNFALKSTEIDEFLRGTPAEINLFKIDLGSARRAYQIFEEARPSIAMVIAFDRSETPVIDKERSQSEN